MFKVLIHRAVLDELSLIIGKAGHGVCETGLNSMACQY